ncbi:MAG: hypothetical protein KAI84_04465 [Gammaproteobacteria bacterium]|nr:hypothetical protein [Gammaproteobacteria bacterium]
MGEKKSFWATLPGIFTGLAVLISAIGGLIVTLHTTGVIDFNKVREAKLQKVPELTRAFWVSRYWKFRHGEGDVISLRVKLHPNGTIIGIDHPNESSWGLEDGTLVFYHASGVPSTRFTSVRYEHGKIIVSGHLLLPGHKPDVIHVLEEL